MICVKFFGMLRLNLKISSLCIEASGLDELLKKTAQQIGVIEYKQLRNSIIFVNGTDISELKGMKTQLKDGDEVQLFSPVSGG